MISFPNAKINLGLNVVSKRPDGYHNIETIFYPIPVKDALEIVRADTFSFTQTGIPVDVPIEKNLVVKALNLLKSRYKIPELEVHLLKAIPFGAGLGGGSADAAFISWKTAWKNLPPSSERIARSLSAIRRYSHPAREISSKRWNCRWQTTTSV